MDPEELMPERYRSGASDPAQMTPERLEAEGRAAWVLLDHAFNPGGK